MNDEPSFEHMQVTGMLVVAAIDQLGAICRPVLQSLAGWERACLDAGMSERAAALFTIELAERLGWPPIGAKS